MQNDSLLLRCMSNRMIIIHTLLFLFTSCLDRNESTNTILKENSNSAHTRKCILFLKEAGATVADSYQLSIMGADKRLEQNSTGNVFVADANNGNAVPDSTAVVPHWISDDTLLIEYDKRLRVFAHNFHVDNVTIVYKQR